MRVGQNPQKFARLNQGKASLDMREAPKLLIATIVYIPRLSDYYEEVFDIMKISIGSLLDTAPPNSEIMIFDNGSCPEVIAYLRDLLDNSVIDYLVQSSENLRKVGAMKHIISGAESDYIYYFDSDILHLPGWYEKTVDILEHFPNAGIVNSFATILGKKEKFKRLMSMSFTLAEQLRGGKIEYGLFSSQDNLEALAISIDRDPSVFLKDAQQARVTYNGKSALLQLSHAQFLCKREAVQDIFRNKKSWAKELSEADFDEAFATKAYMRIATEANAVVHLGNSLEPKFKHYLARYGSGDAALSLGAKHRKGHIFFHNRITRWLALRLDIITFNILYKKRS